MESSAFVNTESPAPGPNTRKFLIFTIKFIGTCVVVDDDNVVSLVVDLNVVVLVLGSLDINGYEAYEAIPHLLFLFLAKYM